MAVYTYTPDMPYPECPICGRPITQPYHIRDPEVAWLGTCAKGHTHWFELDIEEFSDEEE